MPELLVESPVVAVAAFVFEAAEIRLDAFSCCLSSCISSRRSSLVLPSARIFNPAPLPVLSFFRHERIFGMNIKSSTEMTMDAIIELKSIKNAAWFFCPAKRREGSPINAANSMTMRLRKMYFDSANSTLIFCARLALYSQPNCRQVDSRKKC